MSRLEYGMPYEIVIVEDGSTEASEDIIMNYKDRLNISYFYKDNSGPGDSRNYGMSRAQGNYFLILDSDVILPKNYLKEVDAGLKHNYTDCFGGPDTAHESFTSIQKAINYAMTSLLSTGGIRGNKMATTAFEPRSFNMGLSKKAFIATKGFGKIHPGEDPDLSIRLKALGFKMQLLTEAKVFHKRRIDWSKFYTQVNKFGKVRPILTSWHPQSAKVTYWFPTLFCLGFLASFSVAILGWKLFLLGYVLYTVAILAHATFKNKSFTIGVLSCFAVWIQFIGYGLGFAMSTFYIRVLGRNPQKSFPKLFFN